MGGQPKDRPPPTTRGYVGAWLALLCLTTVSFGLSFVFRGTPGLLLALLIAMGKASLVAAIFMQLVAEHFATRMVLVAAGLFVALLVGLMALDPLTRTTFPAGPTDVPPATTAPATAAPER